MAQTVLTVAQTVSTVLHRSRFPWGDTPSYVVQYLLFGTQWILKTQNQNSKSLLPRILEEEKRAKQAPWRRMSHIQDTVVLTENCVVDRVEVGFYIEGIGGGVHDDHG